MSGRRTEDYQTSQFPQDQQSASPASHQLAIRPSSFRSISAPNYPPRTTEQFGLNSPISPTDMATLLNAYPSAHQLMNERMPVYPNAGNMSFVSGPWQEQSDFVTMPSMADNNAYLRQNQPLNESNPWMFRPSPSVHDLDFASEVSAAPSPFQHSADESNFRALYRASPQIKTEDSDSGLSMFRTRSVVPSNSYQPPPHSYQFPITPVVKEERVSPNPDAGSPERSVSSQSRSPEEGSSAVTESRRQKRTYANEDTAKHQCHICKQFFQRSYNLKSHMKTHDPSRARIYVCEFPDCDKSFERRADLTRHFDSVSSWIRLKTGLLLIILRSTSGTESSHAHNVVQGSPERILQGGQ